MMKLGTTVRSLKGKILCPTIELSLTLTLLGGQSFRWKQINDETLGNRFQGVFKDRVWTLWSDPSYLHYEVHSQDQDLDAASAERILREYFRLDEALPELYAEWSSKDAFFKRTCGEFVGIRMLNQDLVENIFSFLCSSNNNIARISSMIDKMCVEYGTLICTLDRNQREYGTLICTLDRNQREYGTLVCTLDRNQRSETQTENGLNKTIKTEDVKSKDDFLKIVKNEPITENEPNAKSTRKRTRNSFKNAETPKSEDNEPPAARTKHARNAKHGGVVKTELIDDPIQNAKNARSTKTATTIKIQKSEECEDLTETVKHAKTGEGIVHFYAFPTVQALAQPAVEAKLRELGFGYRAKFIQKSAEYIVQHGGAEWLQRLQQMHYEEARAELQKLQGIGAKVADCICLMSLSHLQSVPVDTHVYQIAVNHYAFPKLPTKTLTAIAYNQIRSFFIEKFGNYAGWAHSILFCADLKKFQTPSVTAQSNDKGRKRKATKSGGS